MSIYAYGVALIIAIAFSIAIYLATVLGLLIYRFCLCRTQGSAACLVSTVKYAGEADGRAQCVVCLVGFEEGESVKQLQQCKHLFHSSCIDTWLYSHPDCPICRTPVS